ncbi:Hypothetical protein NTJ_09219 [Nesidiocoris tenuis]|uniref:MD-2-related lipid-recognition domain-containing protein n=1 Tax=Nesidiocoris tenuis TaxID=355587 RepID=A0ABN7AWM3_9HEMI|nr:Hypothetical protein NTJ_09219 [Nesidiocoris tenuis]
MNFAALVLLGGLYVASTEKMGPFIAEIQSFNACPPSKAGKNLAIFSSKQLRTNRKKFTLLLDAALAVDFTDAYSASAVVAKKTPQGWKDNYFRIEFKSICTGMKQFIPEILEGVTTHLKLKHRGCPIPAGNYSEIPINPVIEVKNIPAFFYSTFKVRIVGYNGTEVAGCFDVVAETKPKPSGNS